MWGFFSGCAYHVGEGLGYVFLEMSGERVGMHDSLRVQRRYTQRVRPSTSFRRQQVLSD